MGSETLPSLINTTGIFFDISTRPIGLSAELIFVAASRTFALVIL